jgi:hypothetical protein
MPEDKNSEKRQALQSVRLHLGMNVRPKILAVRLEIESLETQFNKIDELARITNQDNFTKTDILSIIEIMHDNCTLLMQDLESLRENIEDCLNDIPPPRGRLCVTIEHCYNVLNYNMRSLTSTIMSSSIVLNTWLKNLEDEIREIPKIKALAKKFDDIFELAENLLHFVENIALGLSDEFRYNNKWCRE